MPGERIYLDYNATSPLAQGVRDSVYAALELANPSSVHAEGRAARAAVERAREQVAALVSVAANRLIFTSGATEAAALALAGGLTRDGAGFGRLLVSAGEHACVLDGYGFAPGAVSVVPLRSDGVMDLAALQSLLDAAGEPCILALQAANNETGVIQPVAEAAAMVRARAGIVVCDAVQAVHRFDCSGLDADAVIFSSHKIGGPKGVGALALVNPGLHIAPALLRGGGQEKGLRAGTENVAGIAGFGAAAEWALRVRDAEALRLAALRDGFEAGLRSRFPDVTVFGTNAPRIANTSAFALPGLSAETLLIALDLEGLAVSSGSACSSGKVKASHVLAAMNVPSDLARGALRVSIGHATRRDAMDRALETLVKAAERMHARRLKPAA